MKFRVLFIVAGAALLGEATSAPPGICDCSSIRATYLECRNTGKISIESLDKWPCQTELHSLQVMDFRGNFLDSLSFINIELPSLEQLLFFENKLAIVDLKVNLVGLKILNLGFNLFSATFNVEVLNQKTPNLQVFTLSRNQITGFHGDFELASMYCLDLTGNNLTSVTFLNGGTFNALEQLDLDENQLTAFDTTTVFPSLDDLNLAANILTAVDFGQLSIQAPRLEDLDLSYNHISQVRNLETANLPFLNGIELEGNILEDIPGLASANLPSLEFLTLFENLLTNVDFFDKGKFASVTDLDLRLNGIRNLEGMVNCHFYSLERLDIANNPLPNIDVLSRADMPSIEDISLSSDTLKGSSCAASNFFNTLIENTGQCRTLTYFKTGDEWEALDRKICDSTCDMSSKDLSGAAIAGIVIGSVAALGLLIGIAYCFLTGKVTGEAVIV